MAMMHAGMGLSKIIIIAGAGYTSALMMKNGKLSDVLGELQTLVKGYKAKNGEAGEVDHADAIAAQAVEVLTRKTNVRDPTPESALKLNNMETKLNEFRSSMSIVRYPLPFLTAESGLPLDLTWVHRMTLK